MEQVLVGQKRWEDSAVGRVCISQCVDQHRHRQQTRSLIRGIVKARSRRAKGSRRIFLVLTDSNVILHKNNISLVDRIHLCFNFSNSASSELCRHQRNISFSLDSHSAQPHVTGGAERVRRSYWSRFITQLCPETVTVGQTQAGQENFTFKGPHYIHSISCHCFPRHN